PHFGASFVHLNNAAELESGAAVSFGETVPLLETDAPLAGGRLQIGILASVFSLFDTGSQSEDLIDTDYFIGVPVSWRKGRGSRPAGARIEALAAGPFTAGRRRNCQPLRHRPQAAVHARVLQRQVAVGSVPAEQHRVLRRRHAFLFLTESHGRVSGSVFPS